MHLVIAKRVAPQTAVRRLLGQGFAVGDKGDDLKSRAEEAEALLGYMLGTALSER